MTVKDAASPAKSEQKLTDKVKCIFALGYPGCGIGGYCSKLACDYDFVHLSVDNLLESEGLSDKPVRGNVIVELLKKQMLKSGWDGKTFLIEGFPRNIEQLFAWIKTMAMHVDVKFVLHLDGTGGPSALVNEFVVKTLPIIGLYEKMEKTRKVEASGSEDEVYAQI